MKTKQQIYDVIVAGSGMGGMTSAALLAAEGLSVLVLEGSHVPGGCSSSYYRKGYIFESGATTLIGFDRHQPLRMLEDQLGIKIPKIALDPSMTVYMNGTKIHRHRDRQKWIEEAAGIFGEPEEQAAFWDLAFRISDIVWKVSGRNPLFPPQKWSDWLHLLKNDPADVWVLPYAFRSVKESARKLGISNPDFFRFLDEQLIISAQASSTDTPFLFGAPAITYTNATNYYVPGGLIEMVRVVQEQIERKGGAIHVKEKVNRIEKKGSQFEVQTKKRIYRAKRVVSNMPVWNMADIMRGPGREYFVNESKKYDEAWGAFTMGVATSDVYPSDMAIHHQIHLSPEERCEGIWSDSIFVSFSHPEDSERAPEGDRVLNISTHTRPEYWFGLNGEYDKQKERVENEILRVLREKLPYFNESEIKVAFSSTPVSWSNWVYRKRGRVGGIPQSMDRSLLDWTSNTPPIEGLYLCGDTVFPGQGIPGVVLSGFNVWHRIMKRLKNDPVH